MSQLTQQEDRILELLGQGLNESVVASATGVSISRISQLLSQQEFAERVSELRYKNLTEQTMRDNKYDKIEDQLLTKLEQAVPAMYRPMEILKSIQVINSAKRRGQAAPEHLTNQQTVLNLIMPTKVINKFTMSVDKQVIQVGEQNLLTMQAGTLLNKLQASQRERENLNDSGTVAEERAVISAG